MTDVQWELGPLPPLKIGAVVRILDNKECDKEDPDGFMYHLFPIGSTAIVLRIKDYGLALLRSVEHEGWVFFDHFKEVQK